MVSTSAGQTNVPRLIVTDPAEHSGLVLALTGTEMVIGHSDTADLILDDRYVSRRHALVSVTADGSVTIHDLNSTGGTFVNDERLTGPRVLQPGDAVRFASITPAAPPAGSTPTGFMTPALSIAGVANLALNLGYYTKDSQIPRLTAFLEGFGGYAGGASRVTLPGGGLSQSGGTTTAGGNLGFLYNFRFEDKRSVSVLSVGATVGLRYQADTVGSRTFPATGGFFGLVAGAAF